MRKIFFLFAMFSATISASAQDVITMRNGDEIQAKVLKIGSAEVEYKKWSNQDGPTYSANKSEIFMIKYQNGEKDVFKDTAAETTKPEAKKNSQPQTVAPAEDNDRILAIYNNDGHQWAQSEKENQKTAECWLGTLGITKESVLSGKDIEIRIENLNEENSSVYPWKVQAKPGDVIKSYRVSSGKEGFAGKFVIVINNKTNNNIYIDKSNCFRISEDGKYESCYNDMNVTVNQGNNSGAGLNLGSVANAVGIGGVVGAIAGGTTVGGSRSNSATSTYKDERFIIIPPHAKAVLSSDELARLSDNAYKVMSVSENLYKDLNNYFLDRYQSIEFDENTTPLTKKFILNYSTEPDFSTINTQSFSLYIKDILGIKSYAVTGGYIQLFYPTYKEITKNYASDISNGTVFLPGRFDLDCPEYKEYQKAKKEQKKQNK